MKLSKFIFTISCVLQIFANKNFAQNTFPFAENLCYTETFIEKIKVSTQINTTTLTIQDKLQFIEKSFVKEHHEYLTTDNTPVHDIRYKNWKNIFPKWYKTADLIRIDETGTRSFFFTDNQYLPGGWSGHTFSNRENGYYGTLREGQNERFYHQDHTELSRDAYMLHKHSIEMFGYLSKFRLFIPTHEMLGMFIQQGYQINQNTSFIQIWNSEIRITWYLTEKTIIREHFINNAIVKTIISKYKYFETVGQDLLHTETEITPDVLENGDCIELHAETTFDDYNTHCSNEAEIRMKEKLTPYGDIEVIPNPASDHIALRIPDSSGITNIIISNAEGKIMYNGIHSDLIDISRFPTGVYIINVLQGQNNFTSKFVKQ